MMAAARRRTADDVLRSLSAIGARIECHGDKVVLRAGARPVPPDLVAAAREAKLDLSRMLNSPNMLNTEENAHLRSGNTKKPSVSAVSIEGAQPIRSEHLRTHLSTSDGSGEVGVVLDLGVAKVLSEDTCLSTFDQTEDLYGIQDDPEPKALNLADVSTFGRDEHLRQDKSDAETGQAPVVEHDGELPPEWIEGLARLDPERPPAAVPLRRWQAVVEGIRQFLDHWGSPPQGRVGMRRIYSAPMPLARRLPG